MLTLRRDIYTGNTRLEYITTSFAFPKTSHPSRHPEKQKKKSKNNKSQRFNTIIYYLKTPIIRVIVISSQNAHAEPPRFTTAQLENFPLHPVPSPAGKQKHTSLCRSLYQPTERATEKFRPLYTPAHTYTPTRSLGHKQKLLLSSAERTGDFRREKPKIRERALVLMLPDVTRRKVQGV